MNEWKLSELNSVKNLTEADLEKTVGGDTTLLTGVVNWFKIFNKPKKTYVSKKHSTFLVECFFNTYRLAKMIIFTICLNN